MFYHITLQILDRSQRATLDYFKMKSIEIRPIEQVRSTGKRELAGVMNDKFPVFEKDRNRTPDFTATTVKRVFAYFAYWA